MGWYVRQLHNPVMLGFQFGSQQKVLVACSMAPMHMHGHVGNPKFVPIERASR